MKNRLFTLMATALSGVIPSLRRRRVQLATPTTPREKLLVGALKQMHESSVSVNYFKHTQCACGHLLRAALPDENPMMRHLKYAVHADKTSLSAGATYQALSDGELTELLGNLGFPGGQQFPFTPDEIRQLENETAKRLAVKAKELKLTDVTKFNTSKYARYNREACIDAVSEMLERERAAVN